ncbi:MAG TPA: hypothetical protein P5531_06240 [Bacteroidales bacterium]|nr:hypothetical protein [Bacteroidales bacterium]HSA43762.1 hypothetical protein [Bacteroidales bacterium]
MTETKLHHRALRSVILLILLLPACGHLFPQDTLRVMSYNLLYYGLPYSVCDESNNNISLKDQHMRSIMAYVNPDILAVCEMIPGTANAQRLLDSALNAAGQRTYARAQPTNYSNGDLTNMLYYDPLRVGLLSQDVVINDLRDINLYKLYLKTSDLGSTADTIFLTAVVAHLKAGSGSSDEQKRAQMTQSLMNYMNAQNLNGNIVMCGDFNLYRSSEQAWQNLTNYPNAEIRFHDPVDSPGDWNNNVFFAHIHTQSTHAGSNGCAASGGLDDRFDFILATNAIMSGSRGLMGIASTYQAVGQDGLHFNTSVNAPPANASVPANVADALYGMSDHLPVVFGMKTAKPLSIASQQHFPAEIRHPNPVSGAFSCHFSHPLHDIRIELINMLSQHKSLLFEGDVQAGTLTLDVAHCQAGMYLLCFTFTGTQIINKLLIY